MTGVDPEICGFTPVFVKRGGIGNFFFECVSQRYWHGGNYNEIGNSLNRKTIIIAGIAIMLCILAVCVVLTAGGNRKSGVTELSLGNNRISDISVLRDMTNLTGLDLYINPIEDYSPVEFMEQNGRTLNK